MSKNNDSCPLSDLIRRMLDETNLFTRAQWADILNVPEKKLNQWVRYEYIPAPAPLCSLVRCIMGFAEQPGRLPKGLADEIEHVLAMPSSESCHDFRTELGQTVGHYMILPTKEAFMDHLSVFPPETQRDILCKCVQICVETPQATRTGRRPV